MPLISQKRNAYCLYIFSHALSSDVELSNINSSLNELQLDFASDDFVNIELKEVSGCEKNSPSSKTQSSATDQADNLIAKQMAIGVVEAIEVIDIEDQQRQRLPGFDRFA